MSECQQHEFKQFMTFDPAVPDQLTRTLRCQRCSYVVVANKRPEPRMTTSTRQSNRHDFILTCIDDAGIVMTHLYKGRMLRDDADNTIVVLPESYTDNGERVRAVQELLRDLICSSCRREIETAGRLCADCVRMMSKDCVQCGIPAAENDMLCRSCSAVLSQKMATWLPGLDD